MTAKTITQLTALAAADAASADVLPIVDVSDTTMAATGTTKKITLTDLQSAPVSAGVANGVLYLNDSKVTTSGSALTFVDGLLTSPLYVVTAAGKDRLLLEPQTVGSGTLLVGTNSAASAYAPLVLDSSSNVFRIGGTEQMRLTSTGLGIGTSSPGQKLEVANSSAGFVAIKFTNSVASKGIISYSSDDLLFYTNNAERLRLDASGNLGLGVTPSAWEIGSSVLQFVGGAIYGYGVGTNYTLNAYYSAAWKYMGTGPASYYNQGAGTHSWYTAPSGTAGNTISFTQAMTLTANGTLLIGDTTYYDPSQSGRIYSTSSAKAASFETTSGLGNSAATFSRRSSDGDVIEFFRNTTFVGSIGITTTATSYNTSSDYRLKNITGPISNSGAYIDNLNPVEGTWKADGSTFVGLIAHEVQEVSRTQVATGEKDGEQMQAMDYSSAELIANLIAEVKSLRARVAALEA